tara:strand:+ start:922 stop:1290 length:369 start_codon:yes stop_codon:yes gene_type:complete
MKYPKYPTELIKKQYYSYIHNLPLFYPYDDFDIIFTKLLKKYPLSPYLDSNLDFLKWINFMQNKTDEVYNIESKTLNETIVDYYNQFENIDIKKRYVSLKKYITVSIIFVLIIVYISTKYKN